MNKQLSIPPVYVYSGSQSECKATNIYLVIELETEVCQGKQIQGSNLCKCNNLLTGMCLITC